MRENNERPSNFPLNYRIESIEPFTEILEKNFLKKEPSNIDSIYSSSYTQDFDISNDSISKDIIDFIHSENIPIDYDKNFDTFFKKNEKEDTISIIQSNNSKILNNLINHTIAFEKKPTKIKKFLGRKKKKEIDSQQEGSSHGIYSEDNISVKVQTHYLNFIIEFLNCIFPHLNFNKKLFKLDKEFKINIKKNNLKKNESLYDKCIGEIISNKISKKYRSINDLTNENKIICDEIKKNPILNKILSENYLIFFKKFYYNSGIFINLKDYGLNKDIIFTKHAKNFRHLLKENEGKGKQYLMSIKEHVLRNYLPGLMFIVN